MLFEHKDILIFTDGGCSGNPGPGAWAYLIKTQKDVLAKCSMSSTNTTNNKMELSAVIQALKESKNHLPAKSVTIFLDSEYVKNGIQSWINNWKKNNWKTANKTAVKNIDLWLELDKLVDEVKPRFSWVKGHSGIEGNEICDQMVKEEIKKIQ